MLGILLEVLQATLGAEVVRGALVLEGSRGPLGVHFHAADRIDLHHHQYDGGMVARPPPSEGRLLLWMSYRGFFAPTDVRQFVRTAPRAVVGP